MKRSVVAIIAIAAACSSHKQEAKRDAAGPPPPPKPEEPLRDAVGDADVRALVLDLLSGSACKLAANHFSGIKDKARKTVITGQIWVRDCQVTANKDSITIDLVGSGWQWAEKGQKKAGGTFEVKQYVKFDVKAQLTGKVDVAYERSNHVASLWFTPTGEPKVEFTPRGEIQVDRDGLWSSIVGGAGSVIGESPEDAAQTAAKQEGAKAVVEAASQGFEIAVDLCKNITRMAMKRLPKGKFPKPSVGEGERVSVEVQNYGAIIYGPYDANEGMSIDVDVTGGAARVNLACMKDAEQLAEQYLSDQVSTAKPLAAEVISGKGKLALPKQRCKVGVVIRSVMPQPVQVAFVRPQDEQIREKGGPLAACH
ncbi:MAG: hypothetical protein QM831_30045 [Kofleriaceae bacterium]